MEEKKMKEKKTLIKKHPDPDHDFGEEVYVMGKAFRGYVAEFFEAEKNLAKDERYSMDVRKDASRRASLLNNVYVEMITILDKIVDAKDFEGVSEDDLELWNVDDMGLYK